jgi:lipopolysaccharide transport system permease protein
MLVFTIVFGKLAKISSEGVPYAIFNYTALVPWTFFSASLSGAGASLLGSGGLLTKVYVPRIIIPLTQVLSKLVDFTIASFLLFAMMVWFRMQPSVWVLFIPVLVVCMIFTATGLGMFLTVLTIQYRDVKHAMGFLVQMMMYACPVVYPTSLIPEKYRLLYGINPMVGVIEGFRSALLRTNPMPWDLILLSVVVSVLVLLLGALFLGRREHILVDVI